MAKEEAMKLTVMPEIPEFHYNYTPPSKNK